MLFIANLLKKIQVIVKFTTGMQLLHKLTAKNRQNYYKNCISSFELL